MRAILRHFQRLGMLLISIIFLSVLSAKFQPVLAAPSDPTNLRQYQTDETTLIPTGDTSDNTDVVLPFEFSTTTANGPKTTSVVTSNDQSGTTAVVSLTPSGTNRFLAVHISYDGAETITAADFDGQALTQGCSTGGGGFSNDIWYLANPNATTADLTITFSGSGSPEIVITAANFVNVDQTTPVSAFVCDEDPDGGSNPNVTITADDTELVFGGLSTYTDSEVTVPDTLMVNYSQASSFNRYQATAGKIGQNGNTVLRWTADPQWPWSTAAIAITPAVPDTPETFELQYEIRDTATAFTNIATHTEPFSFNGIPQMASSTISGLLPITDYHWQVRSCTQDLLTCSNWISYGGNLETQADFSTAGGSLPNDPSNLGPTDLVDGSESSTNQPQLTFDLSDPDVGENVQYQIQISQAADFLTSVVDYTSALAAQGSFSFTVGQAAGGGSYTTGTASQVLYNGSYYWRVRTIDAETQQSAYTTANSGAVAFTLTGSPDPALPVTPTAIRQYKSNDERLLTVGAETTDSTEHLFVQMKTGTETGLRFSTEANAAVGNVSNVSIPINSTGSNRLLLLSTDFKGAHDISSLTFNGQSLTQVCEVANFIGGTTYVRHQLWSLVAPNVADSSIEMTFAGSNEEVTVGAAIFTHVNQATPLSDSDCVSSTSDSHRPTITISSNPGEIVFGGISTYVGFINELTPNPYISQLTAVNTNNEMLRTGYMSARSNSATMSWTGQRNWPWIMSAASIVPDSTQSQESLIPRVEIQPVGTAFTDTPTHTGSAVTYAGEPVIGLVSTPGRVDGESYHWQAQTCTNDLSYCSAWDSFGDNAESQADFTKVANLTPTDPDQMGDENSIDGRVNGDLTPDLWARISDPNDNEQVQFQIQVSDTDNFSNIIADYTSGLADEFLIEGLSGLSYFSLGQPELDGNYAVGGPGDSLASNTNYYWRIRARDSIGLTSDWSENFFTTSLNAPVLSNVQLTGTTASSASLSWDTDIFSNSFTGIGSLNGTLTDMSSTQNVPYVLAHTYTASGLLSCAELSVRAKSATSFDQTGQSSVINFATSGCLGNGTVEDIETELVDGSIGSNITMFSGFVGLSLTIPAGAHNGSADWQIHKLTNTDVLATAPSPTNGVSIENFFYDIKALSSATAQASLTTPATVTLSYGAADLQGHSAAELTIMRWTGSAWTPLSSCSVNSAAQTVTCTTTSTGVIGLFTQPIPTAGPSPTNPTPNPDPSGPGCNPDEKIESPILFQIEDFGDRVKLYFSPSAASVTDYEIRYGYSQYLDEFLYSYTSSNTTGVQVVEIGGLNTNNNVAHFKVRGSNACATSEWSRTLSTFIKPDGLPDRLPYEPTEPDPRDSRRLPSPLPSILPIPDANPGLPDNGQPGQPLWPIALPTIDWEVVSKQVAEVATKVAEQAPAAMAIAIITVNAVAVAEASSVVVSSGFSTQVIRQLLSAIGLLPSGSPQAFVYETKTNRPIPFALIHFEGISKETGEPIVETAVSNTQGLFNSVKLAAGTYVINARNLDYSFPTSKARPVLASIDEFYKGEPLEIRDEDYPRFFTIPMDPLLIQKPLQLISLRPALAIIQKLAGLLMGPLFIFTIISAILWPGWLNISLAIFYVLTFLWKHRVSLFMSSIRGNVSDENGQPLANALLRLIDPETYQVIAVTTTNQQGYYVLPVAKGHYVYQVTKLGYLEQGITKIVLHELDVQQHSVKDFTMGKLHTSL